MSTQTTSFETAFGEAGSARDRRAATRAGLPGNLQQFPDADQVDVVDPYTQEVVASVARCGPAEVDAACRRAHGAQERGMPQWERALVLDRLALLLAEHTERLAAIITLENGKAIRDARTEVSRATETVRFAAAQARTLTGDLVAAEATPTGEGKMAMALRLPIGVVAAITPFNFPLNTVLHKVAPAIAAGCAVVLKPAHQTPLTALALHELLLEAGLPEDWVTVVTDDGVSAGPALVEHPIPRLVTFTGSTTVGWGIAQTAHRKRVALELGSNAPVIVAADADVAEAAIRIVRAAYGTSGQSCISVQRVLVHRSRHQDLVDELGRRADALVVGDPFDDGTDIGPLILPAATQRVQEWIDEAAGMGASLVAGGVRDGACLRPTVVDQAPTGSQLRDAEAFGPVLTVVPFDEPEEAFAIANETPYGLQAGIFTSDLGLALRAVRELDFGGVLVNDIPTTRLDQQPYGGVGDSGNTREGPASAVVEMTEVRFVSFQAPPTAVVP
ncbi:aldehyde dehydrogenase family protein [uncultured Serinicoccus sp.]|uniref:aldehyde dehydrogenase family protein n=1 Tax=uncultured Serinicoccus sp. TaxID=735514 RepID=UPI00261664C3|nr:aldehyde dehydrogenase family protein [uncultured Serinicoccus sp.]